MKERERERDRERERGRERETEREREIIKQKCLVAVFGLVYQNKPWCPMPK